MQNQSDRLRMGRCIKEFVSWPTFGANSWCLKNKMKRIRSFGWKGDWSLQSLERVAFHHWNLLGPGIFQNLTWMDCWDWFHMCLANQYDKIQGYSGAFTKLDQCELGNQHGLHCRRRQQGLHRFLSVSSWIEYDNSGLHSSEYQRMWVYCLSIQFIQSTLPSFCQ